ncbi:uncharacterized protein LOC125206481 [Salvia hispanica]|uniref:uncharacterized protein LOC125206481 n=1 Tax=Salvia hispanica TaxID=49212 RepID=UPI0020099E00|nr:uncharacterized protein LOC125206481 [Salvia hispanica]
MEKTRMSSKIYVGVMMIMILFLARVGAQHSPILSCELQCMFDCRENPQCFTECIDKCHETIPMKIDSQSPNECANSKCKKLASDSRRE